MRERLPPVQTHADAAAAFRSAGILPSVLDFYQTPEWFGNLAAACGIGQDAVMFASSGGLALPLHSRRSRRGPLAGLEARGLSTFYSCRYSPPGIATAPDPVRAVRAIGRHLRRTSHTHVRLDALDEADCRQLAQGFRQAGWIAEQFPQFGNWRLDTDGLTFADYWRQRPGRLRNTGARRRRALLENGPGRIVRYREPADAAAAEAAYAHVAARSWQKDEPYPDFLPGLISYGLQARQLEVWALLAGGQPVAAQIWVRRRRQATIFKLAFDQAWRRQSAGTVLTMAAMEAALREGATDRIDFGWGDDEYKRDWLPVRRQRFGLAAYNPRTAFGLYCAARNLGPKVVKQMLAKSRIKKQTEN